MKINPEQEGRVKNASLYLKDFPSSLDLLGQNSLFMETITALKHSNSTHRGGVGKFTKKIPVFFIKADVDNSRKIRTDFERLTAPKEKPQD